MECQNGVCDNSMMYRRTKFNIHAAEWLKRCIMLGSNRLKEPLQNGEINILDIIDAVTSQNCVKVRNYDPDDKNEHLQYISLGPSYLESQLSRAIKELQKKRIFNDKIASYIRAEIGLEERKSKPKAKKLTGPENIANVTAEDIRFNNGINL